MNKNSDLQPFRILPLGDSITYDNDFSDVENPRPVGDRVAYRFPLYRLLKQAGYKFNFVGNRRAGYNYITEANNAGFPGCSASELCDILKSGYNRHEGKYEVNSNYLEYFKPDLILLHIGNNRVNTTSAANIDEILDIIQDYQKSKKGNPVSTFLARIINGYPYNPAITKLNKDVDKLAKQRAAKGESIIRVDMENALDYSKDMADMVHPNPAGYEKIAQKWFEALDAWFKKHLQET